jgi:hypothetical protein
MTIRNRRVQIAKRLRLRSFLARPRLAAFVEEREISLPASGSALIGLHGCHGEHEDQSVNVYGIVHTYDCGLLSREKMIILDPRNKFYVSGHPLQKAI